MFPLIVSRGDSKGMRKVKEGFPVLRLAGRGSFVRGRGDPDSLSLFWAAGEHHGSQGWASESCGVIFTQARERKST